MANGVFREVPRSKPEGRQAPRVFWRRDIPRDSIHHDTPKAFSHIFILLSSQTSKEGYLFPMVSLGTPLENGEDMKPSPLIQLNPNMLVRDVERMNNVMVIEENQ